MSAILKMVLQNRTLAMQKHTYCHNGWVKTSLGPVLLVRAHGLLEAAVDEDDLTQGRRRKLRLELTSKCVTVGESGLWLELVRGLLMCAVDMRGAGTDTLPPSTAPKADTQSVR